jgi:hypothetical protein
MSAPQNPYPPQQPPQYPQQAQYPPQHGYPQQQPFPPPPPAKKGMPIWGWILIGVFTIAMLGAIAASVAAYLFVKKAEQIAKNPLSAIVQVAAAANPDIEVLDVNEKTGKVTIRDKKNGKTVTIDGDAIKDGKISFESEEGRAEIGTGANSKAPAWVHVPSGATIIGSISGNSEKGDGGSIVFTSTESLETLKAFFEDKYKAAGFTQQVSSVTSSGEQAMQLVFQHEDRKRTVSVSMARNNDAASGTVIYAEGQ